jgi:hypothetical protein
VKERIYVKAYVEIKDDRVEIAVEIPEIPELDIDELDIVNSEIHFDVDRLPTWLVIEFPRLHRTT